MLADRRKRLLAAAIVLLAAIVLWTRATLPGMRSATGFAVFYTASRLALEGRAGVEMYDDAWLGREMERSVAPGVHDVLTATPPSNIVLMLPLAWLPFDAARAIWIGLEFALLSIALWLIVRAGGASTQPVLAAGLSAIVLLSTPIAHHFTYGEMYVFLLFWHTLAWWALQRGRQRLAGVAMGVTMGLKFSGWPLWPLMLYRREWKSLRWGAITAGAIVALSMVWVGADTWRFYISKYVSTVLNWPAAASTAYQTTTGFFQHWFRFEPTWNPSPLVDAPGLATLLTLSVTAAALLLTVRRAHSTASAFALALALTELLNPIAEEYHFVVIMLPMMLMWIGVIRLRSLRLALLAIAATLLITLAIPYNTPDMSTGWIALLAYPRLYGGWLIWLVLILIERHDRPADRSPMEQP